MNKDHHQGKTPVKGRWLAWPLIVLVVVYRYTLSPVLHLLAPGCGCRFQPTCSEYALQALKTHGPFRGSWFAIKRILKCHPWGSHGYDPVPAPSKSHAPSNLHFHG